MSQVEQSVLGEITRRIVEVAQPERITLCKGTEWVETVAAGSNTPVGSDPVRIVAAVCELAPSGEPATFFGDGRAGEKVPDIPSRQLNVVRDHRELD